MITWQEWWQNVLIRRPHFLSWKPKYDKDDLYFDPAVMRYVVINIYLVACINMFMYLYHNIFLVIHIYVN